MFPCLRRVLAIGAASLVLAGCSAPSGAGSTAQGPGDLRALASFYPLEWVAERVIGDAGEVIPLTKPGAEPHDLELSPRDVAAVAEADVVIYLRGFQPAVDDAVQQESRHAVDVSEAAELDLTYTPIEEGEHSAEEVGATDPHFWLDPLRLAQVADWVADELARMDGPDAPTYRANAEAVRRELEALDSEFEMALASCVNKNLVTSHNAFGYLAHRYGLTQVGITGLTPDDEPKPADLAAAADFVRKHGVRTIYYETLVSPEVAAAVAAETGARTAVLDPLEGLTSESEGGDYLQVMRSNLANIVKGQPCP